MKGSFSSQTAPFIHLHKLFSPYWKSLELEPQEFYTTPNSKFGNNSPDGGAGPIESPLPLELRPVERQMKPMVGIRPFSSIPRTLYNEKREIGSRGEERGEYV